MSKPSLKGKWGGTDPEFALSDEEELRFKNYKRKILGDDKSGIPPPISSKEDRKKWALQHGTEVEYLHCLFCGLTRPMKGTTRNGRRRDIFELSTDELVQIRKGGGRQIGFFHLNSESLEEVFSKRPFLFENIKEQSELLIDEIKRIENL